MAQTTEEIAQRLAAATPRGARGRLISRGLARGMIWRSGRTPEGAPNFGDDLTFDLLDFGYGVLTQCLRLREVGAVPELVQTSLTLAAESIESAVRKGEMNESRDFHLTVASVAFHLARLSARSYSLVPDPASEPNLTTPERILAGLMRRNLSSVREESARWLRDPANSDASVAARLSSPDSNMDVADATQIAITSSFLQAAAGVVTALTTGDAQPLDVARTRFRAGAEACEQSHFVPLWWANTLAEHLADDLWKYSLHERLPPVLPDPHDADSSLWADLRRRFINVLRNRSVAEIELWPSQIEAATRAVNPADDLVASLPTSAGKTRIAELCILRTLAQGRRVIYVTPLRALSAQLERKLARTFRPLGFSVTSLYGASGVAVSDVATLNSAKIVVATPEKLDFALRVDPGVLNDIGLVVLDEGHMIGLGSRELRYEVLVQRLLRRADAGQRRIVCLSAIFSPGEAFDDFVAWIRSDDPGSALRSEWRPTRQRIGTIVWDNSAGRLQLTVDDERPFVPAFIPSEEPRGGRRRTPFPKDDPELTVATLKAFVQDGQRVLVYCPQRRSVEHLAELCVTLHRQGHLPSLLTAGTDIEPALRIAREWLGEDHIVSRALKIGVAIHHALLPRPLLSEIEELLTSRLVNVVIASPTLAQGIDLSCSVLIFRSIYRFGDKLISPSEFANVRGRAGRAFVDLDGICVLPIYESGYKRNNRIAAYRGLEQEAAARSLDSGLVALVEDLANRLAAMRGVNREALFEYVANTVVDWDALIRTEEALTAAREEDGEFDIDLADEIPIRSALSMLDTAILGLVDDHSVQIEELANALDHALSASLWSRRLARRIASDRDLSNAIVLDRTRWIWTNTTSAQRRGYYAAGIGVATGKFLDEHIDELLRNLTAVEVAIRTETFVESLTTLFQLADRLWQIEPFQPEFLVENWRNLLTAWGAGLSIVSSQSDDRGRDVAFLQNDVVYRLVWAVEAVRVHAKEQGRWEADTLEGLVPLTLTYGLPTGSAALLAQAGLVSREMVMRLLDRYPASFSSADDIGPWVQSVDADLPINFFDDHITANFWSEFVRRWSDNVHGNWQEYEQEKPVTWRTEIAAPLIGTAVQLVHEPNEGVTHVCDQFLAPLGNLAAPSPILARSQLSSRVGPNNHVIIRAFGPVGNRAPES